MANDCVKGLGIFILIFHRYDPRKWLIVALIFDGLENFSRGWTGRWLQLIERGSRTLRGILYNRKRMYSSSVCTYIPTNTYKLS